MATIYKKRGKWLVQIRRSSHKPIFKSFISKYDAQRWAKIMDKVTLGGTVTINSDFELLQKQFRYPKDVFDPRNIVSARDAVVLDRRVQDSVGRHDRLVDAPSLLRCAGQHEETV